MGLDLSKSTIKKILEGKDKTTHVDAGFNLQSSFDEFSYGYEKAKAEKAEKVIEQGAPQEHQVYQSNSDKITHKSEELSYRLDIEAGPNGNFSLFYYPQTHRLSVHVSIDIPSAIAGDAEKREKVTESLQRTQEFWSNKYAFQKINDTRDDVLTPPADTLVNVVVGIVPLYEDNATLPADTAKAGNYVYEDYDVTGGHPRVLRGGKGEKNFFSTRSVQKDTKLVDEMGQPIPPRQIASYHEFGHVLGLDEEYNLNSLQGSYTHHKKLMSEASWSQLPINESSVTGSIMGLGNDVMGHHYIAVLHQFCNMMNSKAEHWQIVPA